MRHSEQTLTAGLTVIFSILLNLENAESTLRVPTRSLSIALPPTVRLPSSEAVRQDQLESPTPCTEWTVQQLIDHLVGGTEYLLSACGTARARTAWRMQRPPITAAALPTY